MLGNKLLNLRKSKGLSQEAVAEQLEVTRQTVSNWETNQTSPDLEQAKKISKLFQVSIDELIDNNIENIMVEKISNTEKLAAIIIKILKIVGILILVLFLIEIVVFILFVSMKTTTSNSSIEEAEVICSLNNTDYVITSGSDGYFNCSNCSKEMYKEIKELIDYADLDSSFKNIEGYYKNKGGSCIN